MSELANVVTNNETYFFREQLQLAAVCGPIMTKMLQQHKSVHPIKVLSVPSSTGEEPYSIAMNLLMNDQPVGTRIEVYGADVSERALEVARLGEYRQLSFRGVAPEMKKRFFQQRDDIQIIDPSIQRLVQFFCANLVDASTLAFGAPYDIIFCRNVMIYFDRETQDRVIDVLSDILSPGGYLCLGHADAASGHYERFDTCALLGSVMYRRKHIAQALVTTTSKDQ